MSTNLLCAHNRNLFSSIFFWTIFPTLKQKKIREREDYILASTFRSFTKVYCSRSIFHANGRRFLMKMEESNVRIHSQLCRRLF